MPKVYKNVDFARGTVSQRLYIFASNNLGSYSQHLSAHLEHEEMLENILSLGVKNRVFLLSAIVMAHQALLMPSTVSKCSPRLSQHCQFLTRPKNTKIG